MHCNKAMDSAYGMVRLSGLSLTLCALQIYLLIMPQPS